RRGYMSGFFGKLFGKKSEEKPTDAAEIVQDCIQGLVETSGLKFDYQVAREREDSIHIEVSGEDEEMFFAREGQLLDALQLFLTRVVQHQLPESRTAVQVDS